MEVQFLSHCPTFISFFLFFIMVLEIWRRNKSNSTPNLPPGPRKLPFIGNLHQLVGSLPHHALREMARKHGPLIHLQIGQVSTIVVTSPDVAKQVIQTHEAMFLSRASTLAIKKLSYDNKDIIFAPYGSYWRQLRKICTLELLSAQRVRSLRPIREEVVTRMIKWIASREGSPVNLTEKIILSIYAITSRAAFGKEHKEHQKFISIVDETTKIVSSFNIANVFPYAKLFHLVSGFQYKVEKLQKQSDRIMGDIINDHKEAKARAEDVGDEDLVDVLLKFHDNGDLNFSLADDDIKAVTKDIFLGGTETSALTTDWAMAEMIKNPRVMEKAQAEVRQVFDTLGVIDETGISEMKYLKWVIKETLRLHPPIPLLQRECGQQCEIDGYHIPVKSKVLYNIWAIGRDPKYWIEPDKFYPERFAYSFSDYRGTHFEYIPFGAGKRICPGIAFGIANVECPLAMLLYHFDWKLPNGLRGEDLDMTEEFGIAVKRRDDLHLIPIAYKGVSC